jgi:imidazolonepropionase
MGTGTILIRGARQLVTLRGPQRPRRGVELQQVQSISDGALLIRNGVCAEVGPSRRVENLAAARRANVIDATGRVVIPGFVDCHVHPFSATPWSGQGDVTARELLSVTWKRHAARVRTLIQTMIRHGTTAAQLLTTGSHDPRVESKVQRVFLALQDEPLSLSEALLVELRSSASPDTLESVLRRYSMGREAPAVVFTWNSEELAPEELYRQLRLASNIGVSYRLHARGVGADTAIRAAAEVPVVEISHLEQASAALAGELAATGAIATLTPGSYFCDKGRSAAARAFIQAGVPVALASGYRPGTGGSLNMQTAVAMAGAVLGMSPEEALTAATFNAACVAGFAATSGSLEIGKSADLLILNISDYRELSRHLGLNLVHSTLRRGEIVYREGIVARGPAVNEAGLEA